MGERDSGRDKGKRERERDACQVLNVHNNKQDEILA